MQQLFQDNPRRSSTYTLHKNRSFTDSRESYQNGASKETLILRWNNRSPTQEFVLHFLTIFSAEEIDYLRDKIFRYLKDHGLGAVANLEATRGDDGKPNGCVHFHIITDDPRRETELRALLEKACQRRRLVKDEDFCITYQPLPDGYNYFNYFTKYGEKYFDKVILFQPKLLKAKTGNKRRTLQKFYVIGQWFKKGRGKIKIWDEIKAYMEAKYGIDPDMSDCANATEQDAINEVVPSINDPAQPTSVESDLEGCEAVCANDVPTDSTMPVEANSESLCEPYGINEFDNPVEEELPCEQDRTPDRAAVADCCFQCEMYLDCLFPQIIPDRRWDWQRFKHSIAVLE